MSLQSPKSSEAAQKRGPDLDKAAEISAQIDEIRTLNKDELRQRWRKMFKKPVPEALTKDLLARMIAYRIQEKAFGGLDRETEKILESYARGDKALIPQRRMKSGTVLLREYKGVRHTVTIAAGGFIWNDKKYASLSTIAREITGTSWNGPRFFGLRDEQKTGGSESDAQQASIRSAAP